MSVVFASLTKQLSLSERVLFYAKLAHEVTVIYRAVAQDSSLSEERLSTLFQLNEVQHTITDHIVSLYKGEDGYDEQSIENIINSAITKAPFIEHFFEQVVQWTYSAMKHQ